MRKAAAMAAISALIGVWSGATPSQALVTFSNGVYEVHVGQVTDGSSGQWNVVTGAAHDTGAGNDLLFSGNTVWTNFSSLRVYEPASVIDYTYGGSAGGLNFNDYFVGEGASTFGSVGWQTSWDLTPQYLSVTQDVFAVGTTTANSAVYHTVQIQNYATSGSVSIGWRNLYDWTVENGTTWDDGPNNQLEMADGTVVVPATTLEFLHEPVTADIARVSQDPGTPTYEPLLGLAYDPGLASLATTTPEAYAYVDWPSSYGTTFDYTPNGISDVTGDSAGLSWFGRTRDSAIVLAAGESVRLTQTIFAAIPGEGPPSSVVPEPGTLLLLGSGLCGASLLRRRKSKG